ncbi:AraC family transcriptional regulator [bacterium]|nr:MAG: AraC family transcriptional regulator [bacterium]
MASLLIGSIFRFLGDPNETNRGQELDDSGQDGDVILSLSDLGQVDFVRQPSNARHRHGFSEICLVTAGRGLFWHSGREYPVRSGDIFVADPDQVHEISSHATRDLHVAFLSFTATVSDGPDDEARLVRNFLEGHSIVGRAGYDLTRWLPLLGREVPVSATTKRLFLLEMLRPLALGAGDSPAVSRVDQPDGQPATADRELARALAFIEANLHRPLRAAEIAEAAGVSERTLRRRFETSLGQGISAEILERRINTAAHRLLIGFPVAEVAASVGLDPAPFARAFRAARGLPPKRFQKEYRPAVGRTSG